MFTLLWLALAGPSFSPAAWSAAVPQEARARFDAATVQLNQEQGPFRRLLDFDGDGDLDAIGGRLSDRRNAYRLSSFRNDGQGVFGQAWYRGVLAPGGYYANFGQGTFLIEAGRLNGDTLPDVAVFIGLNRYVWAGNGDGSFDGDGFLEPPPIPLPDRATGLALADLDQDGIDDFVWSDTLALHVLTSQGVSLSVPHGLAVSATDHLGLEVLPQDGPGGLHLFLLGTSSKVRLFSGSLTALVPGELFVHGLTMPMLDSGDVDGDTDIDAALFGAQGFRILRRLAPDAWFLEPIAVGGPAQFLADVDGDGDLDGACCGGSGNSVTYAPNVQPTAFEISLNDGTGAFAPAFSIPGLGSPELAGVADVDQDGDVDLVAGRCVYFARGPIRPPGQWEGLPRELVRSPRSLSDYDGDGDLDVGLALDSVHANDGTGRFIELVPQVVAPPAGWRWATPGFPGDFDGDGAVDLLVEARGERRQRASLGQAQSPAETWLLRNDGSGSFPVRSLAADLRLAEDSGAAEASLVLDLDQDGDLDLLTRTQGTPRATSAWRNDGLGSFQERLRIAGSRAEWAGDLDQDGVADLIDTRLGTYGNEVGLLRGVQSNPGAFPTFVRSPAFQAGWTCDPIQGGVSVGDYYLHDGMLDVAFARTHFVTFPGPMWMLVNRFQINGMVSAVGFPGSPDEGVRSVSLGDVNRDALVDAVSGPILDTGELTDISHVFLHTGATTSFGASVMQLLPNGQLVDLDQDGDPDMLAERIVLNRTH